MQKAIHLQIIKITFFTIHSTPSVHLPDAPHIFENTLSYVDLVDNLSLSLITQSTFDHLLDKPHCLHKARTTGTCRNLVCF